VEIPLPTTAAGFLAVPTDLSGVLSTSPTEAEGVCPHLSTRGLRAHARGERLPGDLSISQHTQTQAGKQRVAWRATDEQVLPPPCGSPSPPGQRVVTGLRRDERATDRPQRLVRPLVSPAKPTTAVQVVWAAAPTDAATRSLRIPAALRLPDLYPTPCFRQSLSTTLWRDPVSHRDKD